VFIGHYDWNLGANRKYDLTLQVDRSWRKVVEGISKREGVLVHLGHDREALDALKFGKVFYVETARSTFQFPLAGSAAAITKLE
jgi:hypothetical protein